MIFATMDDNQPPRSSRKVGATSCKSESASLFDAYEPMMDGGCAPYMPNVETALKAIHIDEHVIPITVNDGQWDNSYVVSPYGHYVLYGHEELDRVSLPLIKPVLHKVLSVLGSSLKKGEVNKVVHLNNWMLSTNPVPDLSRHHISRLVSEVKSAYPAHALVFRSLVPARHSEIIDELKNNGFVPLVSRLIHLVDPDDPAVWRRKSLKKDLALLHKGSYERIEGGQFSSDDFDRAAELYAYLYIDKYSACNPVFTARYIEEMFEAGALHLIGLRRNGVLDAVSGSFIMNGVMMTPVLGYDTSLPRETGLYRMITAALLELARDKGVVRHASAGVSDFKCSRGASKHLEYSLVCMEHLPSHQHRAWRKLHRLVKYLGTPLVKKCQ